MKESIVSVHSVWPPQTLRGHINLPFNSVLQTTQIQVTVCPGEENTHFDFGGGGVVSHAPDS